MNERRSTWKQQIITKRFFALHIVLEEVFGHMTSTLNKCILKMFLPDETGWKWTTPGSGFTRSFVTSLQRYRRILVSSPSFTGKDYPFYRHLEETYTEIWKWVGHKVMICAHTCCFITQAWQHRQRRLRQRRWIFVKENKYEQISGQCFSSDEHWVQWQRLK